MGGHSSEGAIAVGRWIDLKARTFAFLDHDGSALFVVAIDAWAVSEGFVAAVVNKARSFPELRFIADDQVIVAATHSHHTPGHVATSAAYNAFAQKKGGFDPSLFELLTGQVAAGIRAAWNARKPAHVSIRLGTTVGLIRNRSIEAFQQNPGMSGIVDSGRPPAIDGRLRSLWIEDSTTNETMGVLALVPVHPTTLPAEAPVYSSDWFGVASRELEANGCNGSDLPVVAIVNGAEGDQSPTWVYQGIGETVRLGRSLAERICQSTFKRRLDIQIETSSERFRLAGATLADDRRVASFPLPGASQVGGAEDGRTKLHEKLNFYEGSTRQCLRIPGHGAKAPAVPLLWPLLLMVPPPKTVPLAVARLSDNFAMVTLPGEFTTTLGRELEARLTKDIPTGEVWPIGLANAYLSYFTTPAEYSAQHYEGGSTLYGPNSAPAIIEAIDRVSQGSEAAAYPHRYRVGWRLGEKPSYPSTSEATCCAASVAKDCPLALALGVPTSFGVSCPLAGISPRTDEEDVLLVTGDGRNWTLRVKIQ